MLAREAKLMTDIAVTKMDGGGGKKTAERNGIDIGEPTDRIGDEGVVA